MRRPVFPFLRPLIVVAFSVFAGASACENEVHLGQADALSSFGGDVPQSGGSGPVGAGGSADGGAGGAENAGGVLPSDECTLRDSPPLVVIESGTTVAGVRITATGEPALVIQADDVTVRNVALLHEGGPGLVLEGATNVRLENVTIEHTGAPVSGPHENPEEDNVTGLDCPGLVARNVRVTRGASGFFLENCSGADLAFIEGHDMRGPSFRGQFVRFQHSHDARLTDFSIENTPDSWSENNVHVSESSRAYVARGVIDGNNGPRAHGLLFSGGDAFGTVEDVDAMRMGNGCFSAYTGADGSVFRRTRCRENICEDQGRGPPSSGAVMWSGDETHNALVLDDSVYFDACTTGVAWPLEAFSTLDLREEDFELRAPQRLQFCWE